MYQYISAYWATLCFLVSAAACNNVIVDPEQISQQDRRIVTASTDVVHAVNEVQIHSYLQPTKVANEFVFFAHPRNPNAKITNYHWDFGDGTTSKLSLARKVYEELGTHEVTLTATVDDGNGQLDTRTERSTVHAIRTTWKASEYEVELGEKWRTSDNVPLCRGENLDCGPTTVTLRNAPNGVFALQLRLLHRAPRPGVSPAPRFLLNGQLMDFTPTVQSKPTWSYETVKTVTISDHELRFVVDDIINGSVSFSRVRLRSIGERDNDQVRIHTNVGRGEVPLPVVFSIDSSQRIKKVFWDFGDGTYSERFFPEHTFGIMGRYVVKLVYLTQEGISGIATTVVTARPSKIHLPGLKDIKHFGFWSSGIKSSDARKFNQRRFARLQQMRVTHLWPYGARSHLPAGIATGVHFGKRKLWFRNDEQGQPKEEWIFDPAQAIAALRATDHDEDGISDLDGHDKVDWVYMGHEIGEYTTHEQRKDMYEILQDFFPNTRIMPYYGSIAVGFERGYKGRFGPGEGDVVCIGVTTPFVIDGWGVRQFDPSRAMNAVLHNKKYAVEHAPDVAFWAMKNLPGEKLGKSPENKVKAVKEMWSAEELLDYARVLLTVGDIEAMIFRAYGRWKYDLSFGDNDADPQRPETGFITQRLAIRTIGGWIHQARNGEPILIIRSPEIGETVGGEKVTVQYAVIHENDGTEVPVFSLDGNPGHADTDRDGTFVFTNVPAGAHRLDAYIDRGGNKIVESDVEILFSTN